MSLARSAFIRYMWELLRQVQKYLRTRAAKAAPQPRDSLDLPFRERISTKWKRSSDRYASRGCVRVFAHWARLTSTGLSDFSKLRTGTTGTTHARCRADLLGGGLNASSTHANQARTDGSSNGDDSESGKGAANSFEVHLQRAAPKRVRTQA